MKIKSLILGSIAAAGLSTGAFAAGLETSVLTSFDVCDSLGQTGLTLSSEENCLAISGGVAYDFTWGDYGGTWVGPVVAGRFLDGDFDIPDDDVDGVADHTYDWDSDVSAWLQFVGTASSSWGPASATIRLEWDQSTSAANEHPDTTISSLDVAEAFVSIGDTTVLTAGLTGSIANFDNSDPLNWLGLFGDVDFSVDIPTGGNVIQITTELDNGISLGGALENIDGGFLDAGTLVGVIAYEGQGNGISANATFLAGGILDGEIENWAIQAGLTAEMDMFTIRGAFAADSDSFWSGMVTAEATFDMFTLAAAVEANNEDEIGFGVSGSAEVSEGVTINAGFRWFDSDTTVVGGTTEGYQAAIQLVAAVSETVTVTGEVGIYGNATPDSVFYGAGSLDWAPGGGFESSIGGEFYANGAYSVTFSASKDFE